MFSGSDEFVLREIADESHNVINLLMKNAIELEFANCLKLHEMGLTDDKLFKEQYDWYLRRKHEMDDILYH